MAVLPIRPTPFFANKNQAFWNLQLAGWGGATMLRAMSALANGQPADRLVIILIATITGFSISLILAVVYSQLIKQKPLVTWGVTAVVLGGATGVYAFIDSWVLEVAGGANTGNFASLFVGIFFFDLTLLGAWSALYYAINFFLQVEEQADRLERLEAQATSAQLAMLRYQLNPHFLFNTLNSISTLVLLKQTGTANAMLTRLSSFLRHTLVTQPGGKVTVAQEVETLKLYLDIERMRFEERLRTDFRIEEEAAKATLPAMLLQPLVENAIKYAVSPQVEGAKITIRANRVADRLRIVVSDTGPGLQGSADGPNKGAEPGTGGTVSTGVGMPNIRDRLEQAYGDRHRFEIRSPSEGGFTVLIEIPYEPDADSDEPEVPVTSPAGLAALASAPTSPGSISPAAVPHPSGR